jgi:CO dehydrogenase nickel-insertion accessory protein CooC1
MSDRLHIGVSLSPRPWRGNLQRHCRDHETDVAVTLLHQGCEVLESQLDVLVLDDDTSWLSAPLVATARDRGIVTVGVFDPTDGDGHGRAVLQRIGIDLAIPADIEVPELLDQVRLNRRLRVDDLDLDRSVARPGSRAAGSGRQGPRGVVIAVGGPAGAGATEISIALAARWSAGRAVVIDVDETHPSLARRLGLGVHPHLLTAIDVSRAETSAVMDSSRFASVSESLRSCLARPAVGNARLPFDAIVGLVVRDDWTLVRADDVVGLIERARSEWPAVIVRTGPNIEDLGRFAPRFDVSRRSLAVSDRLVAVCDATATGLLRFVDWLVDAMAVVGDQPIDVVLNRAPRSPARRDQLRDRLRSIAGDRVRQVVAVPADRRVERAAWDAAVVGRGPFLRSVREIELLGPPQKWRVG